MSLVYCHHCDRNVDTDFEAEHFLDIDQTICVKQIKEAKEEIE